MGQETHTTKSENVILPDVVIRKIEERNAEQMAMRICDLFPDEEAGEIRGDIDLDLEMLEDFQWLQLAAH